MTAIGRLVGCLAASKLGPTLPAASWLPAQGLKPGRQARLSAFTSITLFISHVIRNMNTTIWD